ncbi:low temperature requirement protein A [Nocardia tengchongensis]|uniref:Low temperature requirement protein A n=1 Tax=Nocardia tengchongensis TaxID=2055889 RepID=A0ABX8CZG3_9NOCA|nr:low temperature requirement protein A [Nocardia tengchongensis]
MRGRSIDEPHRASTQLELLFDLTFVVAVAGVVAQLGHAVAAGHPVAALLPFLQVFFAIWWAWMNFTWFASSYDTDDVPYRLLTLAQMAGVLLLAAGIPAAFEHGDYVVITVGYLVMRSALVTQWIRAAREDAAGRATALRYTVGIAVLEVLWLTRLLAVELDVLQGIRAQGVFGVLVLAELTVPVWAERAIGTTWHPHHIAERYSLFTIILLGESVLAVSSGIADALGDGLRPTPVLVAMSGLVLLFVLWWLYELQPSGDALAQRRTGSFLWGYGHYASFAALAALGAGLEVAVRVDDHGGSVLVVGYAVAISTAVFLVLLWVTHAGMTARSNPRIPFTAAVSVLAAPLATLSIPNLTVTAVAGVCATALGVSLRSGLLRRSDRGGEAIELVGVEHPEDPVDVLAVDRADGEPSEDGSVPAQ